MSIASAQLPIEIRTYLVRFASRRRLQSVMRAAGIAVAGTIAWVLLWCLVDRVLPLPALVRAALLASNVGAIVAIMAGPIAMLFRPSDAARVAAEVERREPRFAQRLETVTSRAVGPAQWRGSVQLLDALAADVASEVNQYEPAALLPWWPALKPCAMTVGVAIVVVALTFSSWLDLPTLARRYGMPLAAIAPVTTTRIVVTPGDISFAEGDTLRVHVSTLRLGDASPVLYVRSPGPQGAPQAWSEQVMAATPDGNFESRLRNVDRDVEYYVTGGDAVSDVFIASVRPKPAIAQFRIRYTYPPYTCLAARSVQNTGGDIEAPVGTEVELTIEATEPLSLAVMTIGGEGIRMTPAPGGNSNAQVADFTVRDDRRYSIRMASEHGVTGAFRAGTIRAIADRPPIVRFQGPVARSASASSVLPIEFQAVDDYGLARLDAEMIIARADGQNDRRTIAARLSRGRPESGTFLLDLKALGVQEGDVIDLRLRGEDGAGQFDLTEPMGIAVGPGADAKAPSAAAPPAPQPPSTQRAGDAPPLDPPGFTDSLRAYFEALRRLQDHSN